MNHRQAQSEYRELASMFNEHQGDRQTWLSHDEHIERALRWKRMAIQFEDVGNERDVLNLFVVAFNDRALWHYKLALLAE